MSIRDLMMMAGRNLWKRKLRTFLTVLGVVIGTTSIVVMISIGIGMNEGFKKQIEEWGSLQVIDVYASGSGGGYVMMAPASSSSSKSKKDVPLDNAAIEKFKAIEHVEAVSPILQSSMILVSGKYVNYANVIGIDPAAMEALGYKVEEGRVLNGEDKDGLVIGRGVIESMYNPKMSWQMQAQATPPEIDAMNDKIMLTYDWNYGTKGQDKSIKPIKVNVVGVMPNNGSNSYSVIMPMQQMQKIMKDMEAWQKKQGSTSETKKKGQYNQVSVKVDDINEVQNVQQQIKDMGFQASSLTDQLESMKETTKMLRMVLGAIGAISLIVAAIGITNTMVMAIYERTREIGVMKVIGASLRDIKLLFLTEAAFIGFAGGIAGSLISFVMSKVVNVIAMQQGSDMTSLIPIWLYLSAIGFATVIGILSGYLPAKRAMKLSALAAIKTE